MRTIPTATRSAPSKNKGRPNPSESAMPRVYGIGDGFGVRGGPARAARAPRPALALDRSVRDGADLHVSRARLDPDRAVAVSDRSRQLAPLSHDHLER